MESISISLYGTARDSAWREEFITLLDSRVIINDYTKIEYFTRENILEQNRHKKRDTIRVYTLTPLTPIDQEYSAIKREVMEDVKAKRYTFFCALFDYDDLSFSKEYAKEVQDFLTYLKETTTVTEQFTSLEDMAERINSMLD